MDSKGTIEQFFTAYQQRFMEGLAGRANAEATAASFASCFVEASPLGINCGQNDNNFLETIPRGYDFYRLIGITAMKLSGIEIMGIDDLHYMAKVHWQSDYVKDGKEDFIAFDVTYILQIQNGLPKIFAYITGDEQAVLRERGLIP